MVNLLNPNAYAESTHYMSFIFTINSNLVNGADQPDCHPLSSYGNSASCSKTRARGSLLEYNGLAVPDIGRPLLARFHRSSYYDRLVAV